MQTEKTSNGDKGREKGDAHMALFEKLEGVNAEIDAIEMKRLDANKRQSAALSAIYTTIGKGPYRYRGLLVTIVHRYDGTFFMRAAKTAKVIDIG